MSGEVGRKVRSWAKVFKSSLKFGGVFPGLLPVGEPVCFPAGGLSDELAVSAAVEGPADVASSSLSLGLGRWRRREL